MALLEKLYDLSEQTQELITSSQPHGLLEVAGAEPRGTSTRGGREVRHGFGDHVRRDARNCRGADVPETREESRVLRATAWVETPKLIDDRGGCLDWRFLGYGCACSPEGAFLDEGSDAVGDVSGETEVAARILLTMRGGLARPLPQLGAQAVQPILTAARDSDGLTGRRGVDRLVRVRRES